MLTGFLFKLTCINRRCALLNHRLDLYLEIIEFLYDQWISFLKSPFNHFSWHLKTLSHDRRSLLDWHHLEIFLSTINAFTVVPATNPLSQLRDSCCSLPNPFSRSPLINFKSLLLEACCRSYKLIIEAKPPFSRLWSRSSGLIFSRVVVTFVFSL